MKKIFVTVAEFLENGGKLEHERPLYRANEFGYGYDNIGYFDDTVNTNKATTIWISNGEFNGSGPTHLYFVQIDCTPIYK